MIVMIFIFFPDFCIFINRISYQFFINLRLSYLYMYALASVLLAFIDVNKGDGTP